jgi:hypothetical protein
MKRKRFTEPLSLGIKQAAPGSADTIGLQCALERAGLQQDRKAGGLPPVVSGTDIPEG